MSDIKMTETEISQASAFRRKHLAICREIGSPADEERRLWDVLTWPSDIPYDSPPHPDTARADAAERMLAGVIRSLECHDLNLLGSVVAVDNPGLAAWWSDWQVKHDRVRRIADLTARRDRERAALAATERELEALTR